MSWSTPSAPLVELFDATVAADRRVERRTLFGCPAAFVGGHLVATVFRDDFVLRLGEADRDRLHAGRTPVAFEPLPGRRMRELYVVPPAVAGDVDELSEWIHAALARVAAWPPRSAAGRTRRAPAPKPAPHPLDRLGPRSREWLERAGILTLEHLRELGSVRAYLRVKRSGARPTLNLLWALEGLLTGQRWQDVAREHRTSLLLALEEAIALPPELELEAVAD
jgi:DNA transformation protein